MPLTNCKVELSLRWIENCVSTSAAIDNDADATDTDGATFEITVQNFMFQLLFYQQKAMQNYQNY